MLPKPPPRNTRPSTAVDVRGLWRPGMDTLQPRNRLSALTNDDAGLTRGR
jgi:hypothetical protein